MTELQISTIRKHVFTLALILISLLLLTNCFLYTGTRGGVVVPNLSVKGAPANVDALALTITGPGMKPVTSYFTSIPDTIEVEVPVGDDRLFELVAYVSSDSASAAISFKGTATADLVTGERKTIDLKMIVNQTKLVIPDLQGSFGISRLVQIDDMSGNGWIELDYTDPNIPWPDIGFKPYDVDFDSQGRIYVANAYGGSMYGKAFRIDDITGANFMEYTDRTVPIVTVTVDRYNDYLYYASSSSLWRVNLDGTNDAALTTTGIQTISGVTVADSGILYIAGTNSLGSQAVFRYDPAVETVTGTYTTNLNNVWDAFARDTYVYVANFNGAAGYKILQLDENLSFVNGYGDQSPSEDSVAGNFYGPKRFLGILPRKMVILDEHSTNDPPYTWLGDRLAAIEDLSGSGWQIYGQTGSGVGQFNFYWAC